MKREVLGNLPNTIGKNEIKTRKDAVNDMIEWVSDLELSSIVQLYFFSNNMDKINGWKEILNKIKRTIGFTTSSSSL